MWAGLGGGIGFFAGLQVGNERGNKRIENIQASEWSAYEGGYNQCLRDCGIVKYGGQTWEDVRKELEEYRARDAARTSFNGDHVNVVTEEDPPMIEEEPLIGDEEEIEVPELHPQHLIPVQITEEEFYENPWGYDQESLIFYELDEVLFNKDTRKALTTKDEQDQIVGIGMLFNFYLKSGKSLDVIFVRNDTMGVIFRIDRMDAAYTDEGADPEYEEEDLD